jgi:cell shape-determining protein MreC
MENQTLKERIEELREAKDNAKSYRERFDMSHEMCGLYALLEILEDSYKKGSARR